MRVNIYEHMEADRPRFEPATFRIASERSTVEPHVQATLLYWRLGVINFRYYRPIIVIIIHVYFRPL